jgi:hypothetical protein
VCEKRAFVTSKSTDNTTDEVGFFGVSFYVTPVLVPGAILLLGSGLMILGGGVGRAICGRPIQRVHLFWNIANP